MKKITWSVLIGAVLVTYSACFGSSGGTTNPLAAELQGKGCTIYEESTVTHAKADSELGAFACLGFMHGRDRAWQMDFLRRIAEGRKAEILGFKSLTDDLQMRLLGLDRKAQQLFDHMNEAQRAPFWAYAYGVNQGFQTDRAQNSYEFKHYGYSPDEWSPVNSIEVLLLQSFDQTQDTFTRKLEESTWLKKYGADAEKLFSRQGHPWTTTILKPGEYPAHSQAAAAGGDQSHEIYPMPTMELLQPSEYMEGNGDVGKGSNNWAIAPQRSLTKYAFFANDPHLEMRHPPFWYWAHIEGGAIDAIGASLPGTPVIGSGANRYTAWGLTNAYFDVSELAYVPNEDLNQGNSETFVPWVWVKFGSFKLPFFFKAFQRVNGNWPVLPLTGGPKDHALVLRWAGFELQPSDFSGMFELLTAKNAKETDTAFSHVGLPTWNFTFADTQGAIGYRTVGRLPRHTQSFPFGVPVRKLSEWAPWTYLTADEAPHILQPERGYIVTANNQQWFDNAIFPAGRAHGPAFRAFRIEELLKQTPKHDRESLRKIQCDRQAIDARFILPPLLKAFAAAAAHHGELQERDAKVIEAMKQWDFNAADETCRACGMWSRWADVLMTDATMNREALYKVLMNPQPSDAFLDAVWTSFHTALDDLKVGSQGELPTLAEVQINPFTHFSGDSAFAVPPIPTTGSYMSVNPNVNAWDPKLGKYIQTAGASQRLVVEMTSPPTVNATLTGSNQDIEKPNLADPNGPWMKWKRCDLEQKRFPLDWKDVQTQAVVFKNL